MTAITRKVSSGLADCELSFIARQPIDMEKARAQHCAYEELLGKLGAQVISLPEQPALLRGLYPWNPPGNSPPKFGNYPFESTAIATPP